MPTNRKPDSAHPYKQDQYLKYDSNPNNYSPPRLSIKLRKRAEEEITSFATLNIVIP
jgi:hypothetical protein